MSAKLLYNLSDENPNLNKQIGCMNGIFQVFYRQHYPARRVAVAGDELKSLPSGKTSDNVGDVNISTDKKEMEKSKKKNVVKEKVSSESSSRLSFSSSPCSSSFSSADISTTTSQFEQPGLIQTNNPVRESTNESPRWGRGGVMMASDLKELVKSSIHKETRTRDEEASSQQTKTTRANVSLSPSRNSNEWSEGRRVVKLKDSPRFSYDERETRKTGAKLKETPRLSLDSRSNSFRSARSSSISTEPQEVVTAHRRTTSSVVAKLMGLELIPDEPVTEQNRENRFCDSPRPTFRVESRSSDAIKKMIPAKFPMKVAPWTQEDGTKNQVKAADATLTVYGEIQKRLSQLEFKKSEKDLRALQQILEAMEKTQQMISKDEDNKTVSSTTLMQRSDQPISSATSPSFKNSKSSSIVVMKAATAPVFEERGISGSASISPRIVKVGNLRQTQKVIPRKQIAMEVTPRPGFYKGQTDSTTKNTSPRPIQSRSDMAKSAKSQKPSVSPRAQPKKLEFEKHSRPTSPKPEPNKIQRQQLSRQQSESASQRRKPVPKRRVLQQSEDRLSDESSDLRSLRSDSTVSLASNLDTEVTSRYKWERNSDITEQHTPKQRSPDLGLRSLPKPLKVTVEQPSPVSILDVTFEDDETPSPVRKISIVFKEDDNLNSEEAHWMNKHSKLCRSIVWPESNASLEQSDAKLIDGFMEESGDHKYIAQILLASGLLRDIEYSMLSIQLHQAHLPINPSLFYVLEQSKTSNMSLQDNKYRGRGFGQQQTVNLIEKSKRKLIFDTVNEILARRFAAQGCTKQPSITSSISRLGTTEKGLRGKELLQSLCSEIDQLQDNSNCILDEDDEELIWEDLQSQGGMNWKEIEGETTGLVLDIERLIFKDLISEVVASEVAAFPGMLIGQPRQLLHC